MIEFKKRCTAQQQEKLPGISPWMNDLLLARGINTPEKAERFLHPSPEDLENPLDMPGMALAVRMIREAIENGEKILVYGDYDVDGVSACTVLLSALRDLGADADFRVPHRHTEGYGLNRKAVEESHEQGVQLLITVDCGISNVAEVARARELGMKVIVTDHHEIPEKLPDAHVILDPLLDPKRIPAMAEGVTEPYPSPRLCGAGVALKISQALQREDARVNADRLLEVAALATVADIVPLTDENRVIVTEGLKRMAQTSRPGLRALMKGAGLSHDGEKFTVTSEDIAFRLGPRLNAAGRLEDASLGVRLLMTRDEQEGTELAQRLENLNRQRQSMENEVLQEAKKLFRTQADLTGDRAIVLYGEGWNAGLIGLVAGKFCERLHHPTIVLSRREGEENAVGSCRSIPGINIFECLGECKDLLVRYGGHAQAAGLTIAIDRIPEFRERLNEVIRSRCDDGLFIPEAEYDTELSLEDVNLETVGELEQMEPTGFGNPGVVFLTRNASVQEARRVGKDQSHLKLTLLEGKATRGGIGFGLGAEADKALRQVDVLYRPGRNEYMGRVSAQLQVQALRPAGRQENSKASPKERKRDQFLAFLQEMSMLASKKPEYGGDSFALRPEHLLKDRIPEMDLSDEALRNAFTALRDLGRAGSGALGSPEMLRAELDLTEDQLWTVLFAFQEFNLLSFQLSPFQVKMLEGWKRRDIMENPLIRYIRSCRKAEEDENNERKGDES